MKNRSVNSLTQYEFIVLLLYGLKGLVSSKGDGRRCVPHAGFWGSRLLSSCNDSIVPMFQQDETMCEAHRAHKNLNPEVAHVISGNTELARNGHMASP